MYRHTFMSVHTVYLFLRSENLIDIYFINDYHPHFLFNNARQFFIEINY